MILFSENIDIEHKNRLGHHFYEVRTLESKSFSFFPNMPSISTVNFGFYSTGSLQNHSQIINDLLFEAAIEEYPTPDRETVSTFLSIYDSLIELGISIKSSTPIEEGGLSFDVSLKKKYLLITIYNGESNVSLYTEAIGEVPSGWHLPIDQALAKIESFIA